MAVFFLASVVAGGVPAGAGVGVGVAGAAAVVGGVVPAGFRTAATVGVTGRRTVGRVAEVEEEEEEEGVSVDAEEGGGPTFFFFFTTFLIIFLDSSPADETDPVEGVGEVAAGGRMGVAEEGTLAVVIERRGSTTTAAVAAVAGDATHTEGEKGGEENDASVDLPLRIVEATGKEKGSPTSAFVPTTTAAAADTQRRRALCSTLRERIVFFPFWKAKYIL